MGPRPRRLATSAVLATALTGLATSTAVAPALAATAPLTTSLTGEDAHARGAWASSVNVAPNQVIKLLAQYKNTSAVTQRGVKVRLELPHGMKLVSTRAIFSNALHPHGWPASRISLVHSGITIGDYAPGANALVTITVQLPGAQHILCGVDPAYIRVFTTAPGAGTATGHFLMEIHKHCPTSKSTVPLPR